MIMIYSKPCAFQSKALTSASIEWARMRTLTNRPQSLKSCPLVNSLSKCKMMSCNLRTTKTVLLSQSSARDRWHSCSKRPIKTRLSKKIFCSCLTMITMRRLSSCISTYSSEGSKNSSKITGTRVNWLRKRWPKILINYYRWSNS